MTTNEFDSFTDLGYRTGKFAPGLKLPAAQVNQVRHHALLAHGLGVQAIRANAPAAQVGLAENPTVFVPVIEDEENIEAARRATREGNGRFLTALLEGKYPESYLEREGANAPRIAAGRYEGHRKPGRFCRLERVRALLCARGGLAAGLCDRAAAGVVSAHGFAMDRGRARRCMYWAVRNVSELWHPRAIYITENGCSADDVVTADGRIEDTDRVMYLRNHLTHLHRAAAEGFPVKGYFLWSLLDNFEWADGYSKRFGIHTWISRQRSGRRS